MDGDKDMTLALLGLTSGVHKSHGTALYFPAKVVCNSSKVSPTPKGITFSHQESFCLVVAVTESFSSRIFLHYICQATQNDIAYIFSLSLSSLMI